MYKTATSHTRPSTQINNYVSAQVKKVPGALGPKAQPSKDKFNSTQRNLKMPTQLGEKKMSLEIKRNAFNKTTQLVFGPKRKDPLVVPQ